MAASCTTADVGEFVSCCAPGVEKQVVEQDEEPGTTDEKCEEKLYGC